ncbi:MAG: hypothetical protein LDLANPLL_01551 [Turneriella sp.]|nr:hypothetical protein [Turneriella sp.]
MAASAAKLFLQYVNKQRWALFLYLSFLLHLSLFTHLAIRGLGAQEIQICNKPQIHLLAQVVPGPKSPHSPDKSDDGAKDGGGFERGPMADERRKGEGDFAEEFGLKGGKWKEQLDRTEEGEALNDSYADKDDPRTALNNDVPEEYRNRKRDYRNIIAKDIFPTLHTIDKPFHEDIKEAPQELEKMEERNEIIENYRLWREGKSIADKKRTKVIVNRKAQGTAGRLQFDAAARRKYFDETLSEPKEKQLDNFLRDFGNYDPNEGDLPQAIRDLYYENLQRVASSFNSDMTYLAIDYFHEALNKEEFLRKALAVVSKKKGTKYATEILFAIENIYEIQGRALKLLFDVKKHIDKLSAKARDNIRVKTLEKVVNRYLPLAAKKGIRNEDAALQHYYLKRLEILDYLTQTTPGGYRAKDATLAKGRIFWESIDPANAASWQNGNRAVEIWKTIDSLTDDGDFVAKELYDSLKEHIKKYRSLNSIESQRIQQALRLNDTKLLQKKIERENRILWSSKKKNE